MPFHGTIFIKKIPAEIDIRPAKYFFFFPEQEGVTEALKAADQMEWVRRINSIHNRAEEIVLTELVYA